MMEDLKKQAERFGTDIRYGIITDVDFSGAPHKVLIDDEKVVEADVEVSVKLKRWQRHVIRVRVQVHVRAIVESSRSRC